jgi:hypothetical protein
MNMLVRPGALIVSSLFWCSASLAACHGPEGPLYSPADRSPIVSDDEVMRTPELKPNAPWTLGPILETGFSLDRAKKYPAKGTEPSIGVIYTEPDGRGNQRVCRAETWVLETDEQLTYFKQMPIRAEQGRWLARSPGAIAAWNKYAWTKNEWSKAAIRHLYIAKAVTNFYYLPDGKISHIYSFKTEDLSRYDLKEYQKAFCFRYDKQGRVTNLYTGDNQLGHHCEIAEKLAQQSKKIVYAYDDKPDIFYIEDVYRDEADRSIKGVRESIGIPGMPRFSARWSSKDGLTKLDSYGEHVADYGHKDLPWDKADRNIYNQGPDGEKFTYFFPKPGPIKLLDDLTQITRYNRVRMSTPEYQANVTEVITAKGEVLARWFLDGGMRQDVMKNGKLWRVLIDGGMKHIGNKKTPWWYEDTEPLRAFAAQKRTQAEKLTDRVYEVDGQGKWTLLAANWYRDPPPKPGDELKKQDPMAYSVTVVEGGSESVDGKKTWKNSKAMLLEYGFDEAMTLAQKWGRFSPLLEPLPNR